jgi:hypothetical protein
MTRLTEDKIEEMVGCLLKNQKILGMVELVTPDEIIKALIDLEMNAFI